MTGSRKVATKDIVPNLLYHHRELAKVNISKLKEFTFDKIPRDNPLWGIILSEQDWLDPIEFLVKLDVWLRLSNFKKGGRS